ncbi:MAG: transposase [Desulfovibrio desulfuricans]|nr:transposase [Desulfovibrio desulfuricans]
MVPAQKGALQPEVGRSKGGLTTKVHAVVDALGNPLRIHLTTGNVNDIVPACDLIEGLLADKLLADRAYDANKLLALAERQNHEVVIPPVRAGWFNESMIFTRTKSATSLSVSSLILNHSE